MPVIRKVVTAVAWSFTRCKSFLAQVVLIKGHRSIVRPSSVFHQRRGQGARTRGHSSSSLAVQYRLKRSSLIRPCWYSDHFLFFIHHFFLDINFPIINWRARKLVIQIFFLSPPPSRNHIYCLSFASLPVISFKQHFFYFPCGLSICCCFFGKFPIGCKSVRKLFPDSNCGWNEFLPCGGNCLAVHVYFSFNTRESYTRSRGGSNVLLNSWKKWVSSQ